MSFTDKKRVRIGKNVTINTDQIELGDGVFIGDNVVIDTPIVKIGDYTMIRENTQIIGKKTCQIGMCGWIGQGVIINSTDNMTIGNGVGIGAHSQLWTHIRFGDTVQGCRFEGDKPMIIEDDVWFVGHCLVSPIHAAAKSMAMLGSVITRDMLENHVYAGVPATDITAKVGGQFKETNVDEKMAAMTVQLQNFAAKHKVSERIQLVKEWPKEMDPSVSYFNVATRQYTKRLTDIEMDFMLHLLTPIKFYPV